MLNNYNEGPYVSLSELILPGTCSEAFQIFIKNIVLDVNRIFYRYPSAL